MHPSRPGGLRETGAGTCGYVLQCMGLHGPYSGVLKIWILLFRALYKDVAASVTS